MSKYLQGGTSPISHKQVGSFDNVLVTRGAVGLEEFVHVGDSDGTRSATTGDKEVRLPVLQYHRRAVEERSRKEQSQIAQC